MRAGRQAGGRAGRWKARETESVDAVLARHNRTAVGDSVSVAKWRRRNGGMGGGWRRGWMGGLAWGVEGKKGFRKRVGSE
jgi:hypothetical protein